MDVEPAESELSSLCTVLHPVNQTAIFSQGVRGGERGGYLSGGEGAWGHSSTKLSEVFIDCFLIYKTSCFFLIALPLMLKGCLLIKENIFPLPSATFYKE